MTTNRILKIAVTFSVTNHANGDGGFGGTATYAQTDSTPDMGNIVDADGTVHLDNAAEYDSNTYNQNVDLEFTLNTPCIGDESFNVAWATVHGVGVTIQPPANGGTPGEMEVVTTNNPNVITVVDKDDDSNVYSYKPALEIIRAGSDNYYISLDPRIVNRGLNR